MDDNTAIVIVTLAFLAYLGFKAWVNRCKSDTANRPSKPSSGGTTND